MTIEEKYLELIQADVDGELPEEHRAELSRFMLAHPETRAVREEFKRITGVLEQVPQVEPPAGLRDSIVAAVRLPAPAAGPGTVRGLWAPSQLLRYAAVFAGALLVSTIALQFGTDRTRGLDVSQIAGTMASEDPAAKAGPAATVDISLAEVSGQVSLYQSATMRVVEFDLVAKRPVEVVVVHDGQEARFSGSGEPGVGGQQRYALVLDGAGQPGAPIEIRFLSGGSVIYSQALGGQVSR
jgi:anti-sigma factor RsiW